jgi:hypothetical protein
MVAVGFSASTNQGIWCIIVYFLVHNIDACRRALRRPANRRPCAGGPAGDAF